MCDTDYVMAISDLGQQVSSEHANHDIYFFINFNAEHAGAHGHAQFYIIHF